MSSDILLLNNNYIYFLVYLLQFLLTRIVFTIFIMVLGYDSTIIARII